MNNNKSLRYKSPKQVRLLTAITSIVIVIALVVAFILSSLPSSIMEYDLTVNDLYGITDQSEKLLESLPYDVEIIVIAEEASLDQRFRTFMEKYDALSDRISVVFKDPVLQPSVLDTYETESNKILVRCEETGRTASFNVSGFDGYESAALLYDYNYYYTYGSLNLSSFDAEGQLASAITNVTSESSEKIYYLTGHGELSASAVITDLISKANYTTDYLDLLTTGSIPDDCSLIICNAPSTDMSADELSVLKRWLSGGGKMMLICDNPELPNFNALMLTYGIQMEKGYLADAANYYEAYVNQFGPYCFWPVLNTSSTITANISSNAMIMSARPLTFVTPDRRSSEVEYFMSTSPYGVNYIDENNMPEGTYYIGAVATEAIDDETTSRFTVISASMFIDDSLLTSFASISNKNIFMNALNANFDGKMVLTIPSRTTALTLNTVPNSTLWGTFFAVMVPAIFLIFGFVFWTQRRKK